MTMRWVLLLTALATGCGGNDKQSTNGGSQAGAFDLDSEVRIDSPTMGATVESPFVFSFTLGPKVASFEVLLDDEPIEGLEVDGEGLGSTTLESEPGRVELTVNGLDESGALLNAHWVEFRVVESGPWVTITTPTDGAEVSNPARFGVDASAEIDEVEIFADDWSLGVVEPGSLLSYEFSGTGYARTIVAQGIGDGEVIASDQIEITVTDEVVVEDSDWNAVMLELIETYPTDGTFTYDWTDAGDGTTMDIFYDGEVVAEAGPGRTCFCCGLTFELYMRSFAQLDESLGGDGLLNGMSVDDVFQFRRDWFVRDLWGDGPGIGLANYGLGEPVLRWSEAQAGDPVQFWRFSGSGHSVIFIDWVTDADDVIVGINYWSTQPSTDGVGYQTEYFGTGGSDLDPAHFYLSRAWMPHDWLPWE